MKSEKPKVSVRRWSVSGLVAETLGSCLAPRAKPAKSAHWTNHGTPYRTRVFADFVWKIFPLGHEQRSHFPALQLLLMARYYTQSSRPFLGDQSHLVPALVV